MRKQERRDAKRDAKDGIVRHDNRKDLGIPNSWLFSSRDLLKQIARFREQEVAKREEDYGS